MTKLTDTQLMILSAASQRRDFSVYPLPKSVKDADGAKHLKKLLSLQMIEETEAVGGAPVWREHEDGYNLTLALADEGFKALGLAREIEQETKKKPPASKKPASEDKKKAGSIGRNTKQAKMIALLQRSKGTTIDELAEATGWQRHSVHGVMSGVLRKKLGLEIISEVSANGRTYRIQATA